MDIDNAYEPCDYNTIFVSCGNVPKTDEFKYVTNPCFTKHFGLCKCGNNFNAMRALSTWLQH